MLHVIHPSAPYALLSMLVVALLLVIPIVLVARYLPLLTQRSAGVQLYNVNIAPLLLITLVMAAVIVAACMAVGVAVRHNQAISIILFGGGARQQSFKKPKIDPR